MTEPNTAHATFTVERRFDAAPARVFRALTDPEAKARWFTGPPDQWTPLVREMDARVGGIERVSGQFAGGPVSSFEARYLDIVADRRLVYSYVMHLDDRKISVSLATVELAPDGAGTRLRMTEQGVFLDGYDDAGKREHGTRALLDQLGAFLRDG
jgi:uncharacterized protein YndB with AHSA1/START domain